MGPDALRRAAGSGWTKVLSVVVTAAVGSVLSYYQARRDSHVEAEAAAGTARGRAEAGYRVTRGSVTDLQELMQRTLLTVARLEARVESLEGGARARARAQRRPAPTRVGFGDGEAGVVVGSPARPDATTILRQAVADKKLEQLPANLEGAAAK